ncbi:hypothetical protein R3P38DRAFT_2867602 [Favolaschia claudopus]|uniref:F-box domain-containing protein n=1 Tax=Favolaschia claudopus TaxID=2862362 RepID=A0AAW0D8Z1_9AGAR
MSSELDALHTQIARLERDIGLQREVLRKLEQEQSLCKRRLNDALDPISRLPRELSSEIFRQTLDSIPEPGITRAPIQLLSVCNTWTDIALAIPYLWCNIHIDFPAFARTWNQKQLLPIWLERANGQPLSIWLRGFVDSNVMAILWEHAHQLKRLDIYLPTDHPHYYSEMELWTRGSPPGPLMSLETLTIRGERDLRDGRAVLPISRPHLLELFGLAPNLVDCHFKSARISPIRAPSFGGYTVLPSLRHLTIGESGKPPTGSEDDLLKYLSLPSLEVLSTPLNFRSSPPLSGLALSANLSIAELVACLGQLPDLVRLELWDVGERTEEFLTAILQSSSLVPHLVDLFIQFVPGPYETLDFVPFWNGLLTVLSALRHKLRAFQLEMRSFWNPKLVPGPDVLTALEEFAMDGLKIQITLEMSVDRSHWRSHLVDLPRRSEN